MNRSPRHQLQSRVIRACMGLAVLLWLSLPVLLYANRKPEQKVDPEVYSGLRYRLISPRGNRADAIVGEPGNPNVGYIGAASGGIFKTTDGGIRWNPIFDKQDAMSIGSLAIAPSDHKIVWAGTGEAFYIRNTTSIGDGIYKSTDSGATWTHMGLVNSGRIPRVVVNPTNPDIVFAACVGSGFAPSQDRGVYRTKDGGKTWERVLFVDENTGAADIAMDPKNPDTLLAGMWQLSIHTWNLGSGGPSSGIYISHDGGTTWKQIVGHGLPAGPFGKSAVAIAQSDPKRMYVLVQDTHPGFYRSDDGGENWKLMNQGIEIDERPPYYTRFTVDPTDPNRIFFITVTLTLSTDGGATDHPVGAGGDNHDLWIDPTNPNRILLANDGGAVITLNKGVSWSNVDLPIGQFYHVAVDDALPYALYANLQDDFSWRIPSNPSAGGVASKTSMRVGGCESGFTIPDTTNNEIAYSGCYDGGLDRFNLRTMQTREVKVWPISGFGTPPRDMKFRWNWTHPIALSPNDHNVLYVGSQYVHRTDNGGQSWRTISPDLTRNDPTHEGDSGGVSNDNLFTFDGATLWSIAESPKARGLIWVGSNDGLVHVTRDAGNSWIDVTANIPGLPHWATISNIEPSHFDAATAYLAADDHMQGDSTPHIYKTSDYGAHWTEIDSTIPKSVFSYVACVKEDTARPGLLFAATQNSIYCSFDDGQNWAPLQNNMPHAPASWIAIQPRFGDLVVSTYGRGIWIMDDISPLRQFTPEVAASEAHLFSPRPAYRWRSEQAAFSGGGFRGRGGFAPYGADINYFLKSALPKDGKAEITILDSAGKAIRSFNGTTHAGINRVDWDLRYEAAHQPLLLTSPLDTPWVKATGNGRRLRAYDLDFSYRPPLAPPGKYTVQLKVGKQVFTQPLEVLKDPHSEGSLRDIASQVKLSLGIREFMDRMATMIAEVESVRRQIEDQQGGLAANATCSTAATAFADKALKLEGTMFDVHLTGVREDQFRHPMQLWERLGTYNKELTEMGADFRPTDAEAEVYKLLESQVNQEQSQFDALISKDLPELNTIMEGSKLKKITLPAPDKIVYAPTGGFGFGGDEDGG